MPGLRPCGETGLLVELAHDDDVLGAYFALASSVPPGVTDLVPAQRTVLVTFDPTLTTAEAVAAWAWSTPPRAAGAAPGRTVEIPVAYDGEDLAEVAAAAGLTVEDVVRLHSATEFRAAFCGFAPGFAYLRGLPEQLHLPRRPTPRTRVPGGAVAIAGEYSAVYPGPSPGGWHLLGTSPTLMWDLTRRPPGLVQPGDAVRFMATG
ncbi:5-oxoprolinase subunit B family protein [Motilibacter aurantiacus]|uniref:5-oxoprolinase subunit B family protein n=1 Tax=Motilibacter aurantiacus TaxID=2714955 RepID=UPI00140A9C1A|nr:allophanate hydrolase subunit 1 [Motilibacter aurantiacus]